MAFQPRLQKLLSWNNFRLMNAQQPLCSALASLETSQRLPLECRARFNRAVISGSRRTEVVTTRAAFFAVPKWSKVLRIWLSMAIVVRELTNWAQCWIGKCSEQIGSYTRWNWQMSFVQYLVVWTSKIQASEIFPPESVVSWQTFSWCNPFLI